MFELVLSCVLTALLTGGILIFYLRRTMPDIQEILNDVGASISETFETTFKNPAVKNFMSSMGKKSGDVRADNALRKRVASQAMDQVPGIGLILKQFDLTPIEGLKLMNDPLIGPLIQRGIAAAQKGLSGISSGFEGGGGGSFQGYGREE